MKGKSVSNFKNKIVQFAGKVKSKTIQIAGKIKSGFSRFFSFMKDKLSNKKFRIIFICCLSVVVAGLITMTVLLATCNRGDKVASIAVTVDGEVQTTGDSYNAFVGTAYSIGATSSNNSEISISYVFNSDVAQIFDGEVFTPQEEGSYVFTFTADKADTFNLTFNVSKEVVATKYYTVTFKLGEHAEQGLVSPNSQQIVAGEDIVLHIQPSASYGYTFVGWSDGKSVYGAETHYKVISDVSFTAIWEEKYYSVSYEAGEHVNVEAYVPESCTLSFGTEILLPAPLVAESGYVFIGWSDGISVYNGGATYTITDNVKFNAIWDIKGAEKAKSTINFSLGNHAGQAATVPEKCTVDEGTVITLPAKPKAANGYIFDGWSDGTYTYAAGAQYTVNATATLTAVWKQEQYTVSYSLGDHAAQTATIPESKKATLNSVITLPTVITAENGYIFAGWTDGNRTFNAGESYTVRGTATLTAVWEKEQYTVSYSLGDHAAQTATVPESKTVAFKTVIMLPTLIAPENGYIFAGWTDGKSTYEAGKSYTVNATATLTAVWEKEHYTVSYSLGDHAAQTASVPESKTATLNAVITLPAAISAESGYVFVGWNDGSNTYNAGASYTVTGNKSITAIFEIKSAESKVTISYSLGDYAANGAQVPDSQNVGIDSSITLPLAVTAKSGYVFAGWSDGTTTYNAGSTYTANASTTLTAVWNATVSYSLGNHAAQNATVPQSQTVAIGSYVTLPVAIVAANGYVFAGWTDGTTTYNAEATLTVNAPTTLSAVWNAIVSYSLGNHAAQNATVPQSQTVAIGSSVTLPAAITAGYGYKFVGWNDGATTYNAEATYTVNEPVVLMAVWEPKSTAPAINTIINGDFETGDLTGWTYSEGTENGQILGDKAVISAETFWDDWDNKRIPYNQSGNFHFDGWSAKADSHEEHTYSLRSVDFTLGGSGYISFKMAGKAACVMIYKADDDTPIAEFKNTAFNNLGSNMNLDAGSRLATFTTFVADLSQHLGERLYIELNDSNVSDWAVAFFDDIVTYYEAVPSVSGNYDTVYFYRDGWAEGKEATEYRIPWVTASNSFVNVEIIGENVLNVGFEGTGFTELNTNGSGNSSTINGVLNNPKFQDAPVQPYRPNGVVGKALCFDGYSQYLSFPGNVEGGALTIDVYVCPRAYVWSAPQDSPDQHIPQVVVGSYDSGARRGFMLGITKFGYPTFRVGTGDNWYILSFEPNTAECRLPTYEWSRLTAVFDGVHGQMLLYINGDLKKTLEIKKNSAIVSAGDEILVGAASQPMWEIGIFELTKFNGLMDELSVRTEFTSQADVVDSGKSLPYISYDEAHLPDYALENDYYRPQYHAAPPASWMNEPHTLFKYNNRWHLFYQYNPVGPYWHNISWGHWVSDDMVQWKYVKEAVIPTEGTVTPDGVWTGNVVFDDKGRPMLLITAGDDSRTHGNSNQHVGLCYAKDYSDPNLTEWVIDGFAVMQTPEMGKAGEFRDAQAFGIGNDRYMVVGGSIDGKGAAHAFKTTADKLKDWTYMGSLFTPSNYKPEYGDVWEMPNVVPLPNEDGTPSGKYLFVFSPQHGQFDAWYYIGDFNTNTCRFTPDPSFGGDAKLMDFGKEAFTGPTVYLDNETGKVYICSIMQDKRTERDRYDAGWAFTAGLPRELFLKQDGTLGIKHIDTSSAEGNKIVSFNNLSTSAANTQLKTVNSDLIKIDFTISNISGECGFRLKNGNDGFAKLYFTEDRAGIDMGTVSNEYQRNRDNFSGEYHRGSTITGTIYIDKALIESYIDNAVTVSQNCYGRGMGLEVFGNATFSITVTEMNSIH